MLKAGYPVVGRGGGRLCAPAALVGLVNGVIIAYVGLSPFVTTLGMLAIARSAAVVLSGNRMLYKFGPGGADLQGARRRRSSISADVRAVLSAAVPRSC